MKDIDKFKKLFKEINQEYIEKEYKDEMVIQSDIGRWDCCTFEFSKDGKFKSMYGEN